ncbi:MAG TPA: hypothetical protein RMH99_28355 [Sandaracinaceae bacterium LLY-WYZ-13_1]|nr:hypothetical protein [Sandaracinaceae bacterium LLY-WYZ-13_1]
MLELIGALFAGFAAYLLAFALGLVLGLGRLLETEGWRWAPGARWVLGAAGATAGVGMLAVELDAARAFWAGFVLYGVLDRRFRGACTVLPALAMAGFVGWTALDGRRFFPLEILFVASGLSVADGLRARLRPVADHLPDRLALLVDREDWGWLLVASVQLAFFGWDWTLLLSIGAFHAGRRLTRRAGFQGRLRSWGLRPPIGA